MQIQFFCCRLAVIILAAVTAAVLIVVLIAVLALVLAVILTAVAAAVLIAVLAVVAAAVLAAVAAVLGIIHIVVIVFHGIIPPDQLVWICYRISMSSFSRNIPFCNLFLFAFSIYIYYNRMVGE